MYKLVNDSSQRFNIFIGNPATIIKLLHNHYFDAYDVRYRYLSVVCKGVRSMNNLNANKIHLPEHYFTPQEGYVVGFYKKRHRLKISVFASSEFYII